MFGDFLQPLRDEIQKHPTIKSRLPLLSLAAIVLLTGCETLEDQYQRKFIENLTTGAEIRYFDESIYVAKEARRRTSPRILNGEDNNLSYAGIAEKVTNPGIIYTQGECPTWLFWRNASKGLVFSCLRADTDEFFQRTDGPFAAGIQRFMPHHTRLGKILSQGIQNGIEVANGLDKTQIAQIN